MKVHLVNLRDSAMEAMEALHHASEPPLHDLVPDPAAADLIVFVGGWADRGEGLVESALPRLYPEKCFVYLDNDGFVPLLPGIYTNAEQPSWIDLRRSESQMFIAALNPHVMPLPGTEKKYLFSFAGGSTSLLRKKLYKIDFGRKDVVVKNTSNYFHWDPSQEGREQRQKDYATLIASSHFGLCPRGASSGGLRLFEVMQMGVAPVVVSDKFQLPVGPAWDRFLLRVPERRMRDLPQILEMHLAESAERGRLAREAYVEWFAPPVFFNRVIESCVRLKAERRIPERWIQPFWGFMLWRQRVTGEIRGVAKRVVLGIFKLLRLNFVYEMNTR